MLQIAKTVKRSHQSFVAATSRRKRRPFADSSGDLDESMHVNRSNGSDNFSSIDAFDGRTKLSHSELIQNPLQLRGSFLMSHCEQKDSVNNDDCRQTLPHVS